MPQSRGDARSPVLAALLGSLLLAQGFAALPALGAEGDTGGADPTAEARALVEDTLGRVLAIINDQESSSERRRARIEDIADDVFDFETMSKLSMARNWKRLSKAQRPDFVREFRQHLARNYGSRLDRYQQTDVAVVGTREEPRGDVTVLSKVIGGQFDGVKMNYRLRHRKGTWKVIDVVIEGVSLVANFRSQFAEVMSRGGPDELLHQLRTRNFDVDPEEG